MAASTCCKKSNSCHCDCSKAAVENVKPTDACSCGMRQASQCTCSRKNEENAGLMEGEVDFTNLK
ncbi:hypothetical protein B0I73DRAFT_145672 [Yarrowia lipolytica]|uniref:DUF7871 domain-containing protein n=1 Tax=Yarrowia lipolytica TaxID=4952 RepID=A0A371CC95_YARLL|nr:hypothetical protein BKA91DRAFT_147040 [Yarrowia lipolytica]KAE8172858.1 hypothetical protein BKA90DRAFT_146308 [Yarrowia lipolytica]RDW27852.1 hypothetical protein B0I71DRAFT_173027 [Yarrowia lipolytica]RDW41284.1 hypothetical protein B0I73DRAFT_145672 [Yarrowia lipolytica]RDW46980.1 hypothetical protein B0I74DRAFT_145531 [Yarrowia lipolytica]